MTPAEIAARTYIDVWLDPDRARRAQRIEACFAADGRIAIGAREIRGRAELAAAIEAFQVDPRRLTARLSSAIDAGESIFRFRAVFDRPDGGREMELLDVAEVDREGRIATLYTFTEPLPEATQPPAVHDGGAAAAAQRYVDAWAERDPAVRRSRLAACFADGARLVSRGRTLHGAAEIAAMGEAVFADPRVVAVRRTSGIEAGPRTFRFAAVVERRGAPSLDGEDAGEIDDRGRIAVIYTFAGPLRAA